ncbi:hypothetical protein GCM10010302_39070 [Streptomyces polychromogenes]|uniref:Uncharacterized protein n=1 Tax=Streptomyces polychromogenes TaxID=67342 RepID=A0ABN0VFR8_9ACTN
MDGDDGLESGGPVLAQHDLLVAALLTAEQGVQDAVGHFGHGGDSHGRDAAERRPPCGWGRAHWEQSKTCGGCRYPLSGDRNAPGFRPAPRLPLPARELEVNRAPEAGRTRG